MELKNGEYKAVLNGIVHWIKIDGSQNNTVPLVLLHGGPGGNHYVFERTIVPLLSSERTVIYYEQRGCGRTEKPSEETEYSIDLLIEDFAALFKWLDVKKVDLLGYSFGGELALEIAHNFPMMINKIILSGPSLIDSKINKFVQITGFCSVVGNEMYKQMEDVLNKNLTIAETYNAFWELADSKSVDLLLFQNQDIARRNRELWEESNLVNTGHMFKGLQQNPVKRPLIGRLKEIDHQTLIMTGVFDRNTGIPISTIINREMKNSEMVLFHHSAHFPDLEEPEKYNRTVQMFLIN
ncbi:alpha/beta fold hydrolase [Fictibacillus barbaricus]|uniref:Proline iminopeptidase n=1 Tax=Fictibacillus barbaricus TaxID=182136 RepID=A0ABU1TWS2_9BACL|nr:alpha/beta fold hydrolase [Fictibacillus barbaricus]MDR7071663.1 proline iminopeptidase [Fictibacillus barbaricus]